MTASAADVCGAIALDKTMDASQPVVLPNSGAADPMDSYSLTMAASAFASPQAAEECAAA